MAQPQLGPLVLPRRRSPASDDFATGPKVGELIPDFTLPDQNGKPVNFTEARSGHKALVRFHRSASW